jgi:Phage integrase family
MDDWQHQKFDPPSGESGGGQWQVHISLAPAEVDGVRRFASQVLPAENFEIHTELGEGGEEGEVIFAVRLVADSAEDATAEARFKLNKIRRAAGLPDGSVAVVGYISPQWRRDPARHLGREATDLLMQGRDALAVVRIQTACEFLIAETLEKLLAARFPDVRADHLIRRPATLADKTSLALCQLLTGVASWTRSGGRDISATERDAIRSSTRGPRSATRTHKHRSPRPTTSTPGSWRSARRPSRAPMTVSSCSRDRMSAPPDRYLELGRSGVDDPERQLLYHYTLRAVRFHDLRHTFGTHCAAAGVPMRTLQEWMGHAQLQTTEIYADYAPSSHEKEMVERAFAPPEPGNADDDGGDEPPEPTLKAESPT